MSRTTIVRQRSLRCGECGRVVLVQAEGKIAGGDPILLPTTMPAPCQRKGECQEDYETGMLDPAWWETAREIQREEGK